MESCDLCGLKEVRRGHSIDTRVEYPPSGQFGRFFGRFLQCIAMRCGFNQEMLNIAVSPIAKNRHVFLFQQNIIVSLSTDIIKIIPHSEAKNGQLHPQFDLTVYMSINP